jgi:GTP-binding protein
VNDEFVLADLPGYGYARISKERKADWRPLIEGYLRGTSRLAGVVHLLDIRRDPNEDDRSMLDFLAELELPTIVVLTKADKISRAQAESRLSKVSIDLGLDPVQTIRFSAATGEGREELASAIAELMTGSR